MLPSASDIRYFLEAASTLNISRAAERLGIAQPSLSASIQRLETTLGTPLFLRGKSGVRLTQAGHFVVRQGAALLQEWEAIRSGALNHANAMGGRFSIGCHESVAHYALPTFLPRLLKHHSGIAVHLEHGLSREIAEQVISYQVDFGIVINPVSHPDLVIQDLCKDRVSVWSKTGDYSETLIFDPDLHQSQVILKLLEQKHVRFERSITSSSLEIIADLAAAGAGTAILPARVATRTPRRLRKCEKIGAHFDDRVCLIYRGDSQRTPAAKAIVNAIRVGMSNPTA